MSLSRMVLEMMSKAPDKSGAVAGREAIRAALAHRSDEYIPKGEIWLGRGVFRDLGWEDGLESRLRLCSDLGMDMISLCVGPITSRQPYFNYRYFSLAEVGQILTTNNGLFTVVIFDGAFQRLSQKMGLSSMLASLGTHSVMSGLRQEALRVGKVATGCLELKPDAIVIADDIAHSHATFASPRDLRQILFSHYGAMIQRIRAAGIECFFHSDGNFSEVIPDLIRCGFTGLAACEPECQNLPALKQRYGSQLTFISGVSTEFLEAERLGTAHRDQFIKFVSAMSQGGGFILCSSCGLSSKKHLDNLKTMYQWADEG